jgi:glyoxylase-like metal-dependent hydrolase (beta-lactamase superfamily II)
MSKTILIRSLAAALSIAGLSLVWSQGQRGALTMEKVTPNLYVIIGNGGNVAVMPTSEGVILVDDKFAQDGPDIVAKVKTITDKPIRYIVNTHQHPDHTGGNEAFLAANAEILIQKNARANMVTNKMPGLPRITFNDESELYLGGKELRAKYFGRGHTNGDAMVYFPSERVLHTGDLFVSSGAPFIDTANGGSIKDLDKTVQKALDTFDFDIVIPGHGAVAKRADLVKWVATIGELRNRISKACAGGAADASKRLDIKDLGMSTGGLFDRGMPGMCKELAGM